jgi:3-(3-hydroxy-phenyl)propionate hydroxylase
VSPFVYPTIPYVGTGDARAATPADHEVVIVGAGPVGLVLALDLAKRGRRVLLLDEDDSVSTGSRAICWSKRTLEIMDRLGLGDRLVAKGVTWHTGRVFFRERELYRFDLLPETGHRMPAFINLQQYYFEQFALEAVQDEVLIELRPRTRLVNLARSEHGVLVTVDSPQGPYRLHAGWLIACDGARSQVRHLMGLEMQGRRFEDRFLIADVRMRADFPAERWFWFEPPFHSGGSALLHRQADDIWRIDLQLGHDADSGEEKRPDRVIPRLQAMLGPDRPFELEWVSVYSFQCCRVRRFRHGRVIFAGDSAHIVSPFGARGGNGGIQDADNLAWKLDLVLDRRASERLLDSYDLERGYAADENIGHSIRSTDFISPKGEASRSFRDAVLDLAADHAFAQRLVNSGRLSVPVILDGSPLNTADDQGFAPAMRPGSPCTDAPVLRGNHQGWLLHELAAGFTGLWVKPASWTDDALDHLAGLPVPVHVRTIGADGDLVDRGQLLSERYQLAPDTFYLIRPDQHVAARWRHFDPAQVEAAVARACGAEMS